MSAYNLHRRIRQRVVVLDRGYSSNHSDQRASGGNSQFAPDQCIVCDSVFDGNFYCIIDNPPFAIWQREGESLFRFFGYEDEALDRQEGKLFAQVKVRIAA